MSGCSRPSALMSVSWLSLIRRTPALVASSVLPSACASSFSCRSARSVGGGGVAAPAVASGRAASVSAYVAAALREQVEKESVAEVLSQWRAEAGPLTADDEAWVEAALEQVDL